MRTTPHDHVFHCVVCYQDTVAHDCVCLTPISYVTCWSCKAEGEYNQVEALRNADY